NRVAPPLVGNFVRGYLLHEAGEFVVDVAEEQPSLGRIRVGRDGKVNQVGPGLPKIKIWLLRDVDLVVRTLAEIKTAELQLGAGLFEGILRHAAGRQTLQRAIPTQLVGQLTQVVARNLEASFVIRQVELGIFAVVESRHRHWDRRDPVADRQTMLNRLALQRSDADDFVFRRDFEGKIVESLFAKSIQVRIPGGARSDVVTSFSRFFQDLIARVLDVNCLFLTQRRRLRKHRVKRTVLLAALLNEIEILALLVGNPRDSQIRQQAKLKHSFPSDQRLEADIGAAE